MQSTFAPKMIPSISSTCTIGGGGDAPCLCKTSKIKRVKDRSRIAISKNLDRAHGRRGDHYASY